MLLISLIGDVDMMRAVKPMTNKWRMVFDDDGSVLLQYYVESVDGFFDIWHFDSIKHAIEELELRITNRYGLYEKAGTA